MRTCWAILLGLMFGFATVVVAPPTVSVAGGQLRVEGDAVRSAHAKKKRRKRRRRRRAKKPAPPPPPAPTPAAGSDLVPGSAFSGPTRIDFDDRLIQGQTNKSGAVYLFDRKETGISSMVRRRKSFRHLTIETVFDR